MGRTGPTIEGGLEMSLFLNDEMELLQESAREFAERYVAAAVEGMEAENEFPRELYLKAGELGFLGLIVPEKIGGAGLGLTAVGIVTEEIAKVSPAFAISYYVDSCMSSYLMESPNRVELLKKYLPGVMTGWTIMGAGITPPQGSTNLSEWPVMAKKDGDEWVLNGSKLYVTNTSKSDLVAFLGMTEEREMRCFFVETKDPGVDDRHVEKKLGLNGNCSGSYFLTDVRVPDSCSFPKNPLDGMGPGNALCAAVALGCAEAALAKTMEFVKQRTHDSAPIAECQVVRHRIARMWGEIEKNRALVFEALATADKVLATGDKALGAKAKALICTAKYSTCEMAVDVTKQCIWLHGGLGIVEETGVARYLRDAETLCIADGTPDLHVESVSAVLGMPGASIII